MCGALGLSLVAFWQLLSLAPEARAVASLVRELTERCTREAGGRLRAEIVDPDRAPDRAEAAAKRYGIGAYEMGQGVVIFTSGTRAKTS